MIHRYTYGLFSPQTDYVYGLVLKYEAFLPVSLIAMITCMVLLYNASRQMKTFHLFNINYATKWH